MIAIVLTLAAVLLIFSGYLLSRIPAQRPMFRAAVKLYGNHLEMARLIDHILEQDKHVPTLDDNTRDRAEELVDRFYNLKQRTIDE